MSIEDLQMRWLEHVIKRKIFMSQGQEDQREHV